MEGTPMNLRIAYLCYIVGGLVAIYGLMTIFKFTIFTPKDIEITISGIIIIFGIMMLSIGFYYKFGLNSTRKEIITEIGAAFMGIGMVTLIFLTFAIVPISMIEFLYVSENFALPDILLGILTSIILAIIGYGIQSSQGAVKRSESYSTAVEYQEGLAGEIDLLTSAGVVEPKRKLTTYENGTTIVEDFNKD